MVGHHRLPPKPEHIELLAKLAVELGIALSTHPIVVNRDFGDVYDVEIVRADLLAILVPMPTKAFDDAKALRGLLKLWQA